MAGLRRGSIGDQTFFQVGTGAVERSVRDKLSEWVTPQDFMTDAQKSDVSAGTRLIDVTDAVVKAFAASNSVLFPPGDYRITLTDNADLVSFVSQTKIQVVGNGACLYEARDYSNRSGVMATVFSLDACIGAKFIGLDFEGVPLSNPSSTSQGIGYNGATFINLKNGCEDIEVAAKLQDLRYGVRSGDYNLFSQGYNKRIKTTITAKRCGYPIAHYLAEDIEADIYAEDGHRAAYVAGLKGGKINAKFKNQYIAPIQVLLTDATTNGLTYPNGASRGCSNLRIKAHDAGSTTWVTGSFCAGIAQSRGDAGIVYEDIEFDVYVKSSDTVAATLGALGIYNSYTPYEPSYPGNWTNPPAYRNIRLTGTLDRSAQTIQENNSNGEIYVYLTDDAGSNATVQGFSVRDFIYSPGSGAKPKGFWFSMPGLVGQARFDNCNFGTDSPLLYRSNATSSTLFTNTTLRGSYFGNNDTPYLSWITFVGCKIGDSAHQPTTNKTFIAAAP